MSAGILIKKGLKPSNPDADIHVDSLGWENATCPICLDTPHNAVLLRCAAFERGCRPFVCDTGRAHSNCLDRFRTANGMLSTAKIPSAPAANSFHIITSSPSALPSCPLCRGDVLGWIVIEEARVYLNRKQRCCEEAKCSYAGSYSELQNHALKEHPNSRPAEIDPARRLKWEDLQQSTDIIDVLSTIRAQVPNGIVVGDYVIEYGDDEARVDFEVYRRVRPNWWASCIFCKCCCVSRSQRGARDRRGSSSSSSSARRRSRRFNIDNIGFDDSIRPIELREIRFDEIDDEFISTVTGNRSLGTRTGSLNRQTTIVL